MQKGYTILTDEDGCVIREVAKLRDQKEVSLEGSGGFAEAMILSAGKKTGKEVT